jgi:hypothetical protein
MRNLRLTMLMVTALVVGCESAESEQPATTGPIWQVPDGLRETAFFVPGVSAGANPRRGGPPPAELEGTPVIEVAARNAPEPEVIVMTVSGVYAGANNFRVPAWHVIRATDGRVRFWMTERRSNGLEDLTGVEWAEQTGDLDAAMDYYFAGRTLAGRRFAGFEDGVSAPWLSEWGLGTHFGDLTAVLREARRRHPAARIVWAGHSMGSMWGEAYSAWDLDCDPATPERGRDLVDGWVLLDGTAAPVLGFGEYAVTETDYLQGIPLSADGTSVRVLGLDAVREGQEIVTDIGAPALFLALELGALAHRIDPDRDIASALSERVFSLDLLQTLLFGQRSRATGGALLGLALDDDYEPIAFARFRMGRLVGPEAGRLLPLDDDERPLYAPSDTATLYRWTDRSEHAGRGPAITMLDEVAESFYAGPANFLEWYFPIRLPMDLSVALGALLGDPDDIRWGWPYGLCFTAPDGLTDPVLAVAARWGVAPSLADYDPWLAAAGVSDVTGLLLEHNHLDMLVAGDAQRNPLLPTLTDWLRTRFLD